MNIENELQKNNFYDIKKIADSKAYSFFYISHKLKVKGFLVLPKKLKKKNNPLIFVCRGGTRDFCMIKKENLNMYDFLIKAGYVVCLTQYRGVDGGEGEDLMGGDDVFDVIHLIEQIKNLSFIDQKRIGLCGASRGGTTCLQVVARMSAYLPIAITSPCVDEFKQKQWRKNWKDHQSKIYGGSDIELWKRSPAKWIHFIPKNTPIFIAHGTNDDRTSFQSSKAFYKKLKTRKFDVNFKEMKGEDHFIFLKVKKDILKWFKRWV